MRKQLAFAFAAAAIGLITIAWAKDSIVVPNHDVVRPKTELGAARAQPKPPVPGITPGLLSGGLPPLAGLSIHAPRCSC